MGITAKQFVRLLQKSGIIADEELAAWLKKNKSDDVKKLARKLIADEVLTRWQAKYIFGGKYKLKFGSYELLERSEQNSVGKEIGSRFLALHKQFNRKVEMLFLSTDLCKESNRLRELIRQVGMMSEVGEHPNLERVYDIDKDDKRYYLITEHLIGRPVSQLAENQQLTSVHVADIARQAIMALAHAHEMGVTHGNLTTNDMILDNHRQLKIRNIVQAFLARNLNQESNLTTTLPSDDWESLRTICEKILSDLPEKRLVGDTDKLTKLLSSINVDLEPETLAQELSNWIDETSKPANPPASAVTDNQNIPIVVSNADENDVPQSEAPMIDLGEEDSANRAAQSFSGLSSLDTGEKKAIETTSDVAPIEPETAPTEKPSKKPSKRRSKKRKRKSSNTGFEKSKIPGIAAGVTVGVLLLGVIAYALGLFSSTSDPVTQKDPSASEKQSTSAIPLTKVDAQDKSTNSSSTNSDTNEAFSTDSQPDDDFSIDDEDGSDDFGSIDPVATKEVDDETSLEDQLNSSFIDDLDEPTGTESTNEDPAAGTASSTESPTTAPITKPITPKPTVKLPFADLKPSADIPLAENTAASSLGTVYPYRNTRLKPTLIWDPELVRGGTNFEIVNTSNPLKWNVIGKTKEGEIKTIAELEHEKNTLQFKWLPVASDFTNANYLRNAILQLEFPGQKQKLRLRKPMILDGFKFAIDKPEIQCEATVDWLPQNVTATLNELSPDIYGELYFEPESRNIDRRKGLRIALDAVAEDRIVSIFLKSDVRKKLKLSGKVEILDEKGRVKTATTDRINGARSAIEQLLKAQTNERDMFKNTKIAEIRKHFNDESIKDADRDAYVKKLEEEMGIAESRLASIDGYAKRLANFQVRPVPVLVEYELAGEKIVVASTWDTEFVERKIEGEQMDIVSKTRGSTSFQSTKGNKWSGARQLWWRDAKVGSTLDLEFTMPSSGKFKVVANLTLDQDYGKHKISINGVPSSTSIDEYAKFLTNRDFELGTFDLKRGTNSLKVEVIGANSAANPRHMFGLDFLKVETAKE